MSTMTATSGKAAGMTKDERFVILASSLGTVFEWYDFYLYGSLASIIGVQFFSDYPPGTRDIFALLAFIVGLLPNAATIGIAAPIILIALRLLQGLALGGEYGGAATYVAEHSPMGKRGYYTSWIQTTATVGLFMALLVILGIRTVMGEAAFSD